MHYSIQLTTSSSFRAHLNRSRWSGLISSPLRIGVFCLSLTLLCAFFASPSAWAQSCSFAITPKSQTFTSIGGSGSIGVTTNDANCAWAAFSHAAFITVTSIPSSGAGNGSINYSVAANPNPQPRSGTIAIAGKTFTVTQAGCTFAIAPTFEGFAASGGPGSIGIATECAGAWTAMSNAGFITITSAPGGNGDGTLDYSVAANPSAAPRSGTITVAGKIFTVTQAGLGAPVVKTDFNADGFVDYLLSNSSTRRTAIWYLHDSMLLGGAFGPTLPAGWSVVGVADINSDSKQDYLLFNATTRQTAIWFLNNATFLSGAFGPTLPPGWALITAEDMNNDGKPDYVLFKATTRQTVIWYLDGTDFVSAASGPTLPSGWTLSDAVDFNGDSKPDFVLRKASTRQTAIWYLNGNVYVSAAFGPTLPAGWTLQGAADFNSDGSPDYVLYNSTTTRTALWYLNGATFASSAFGPTLAAGYGLASP